LDVALGPRGEQVGPHGEPVAFGQRVAHDPPQRLRAAAAREPDDPGRGLLFAERGEAADGGRGRVTGADDEDVASRVDVAALAEELLQAVGDVSGASFLARRRDAALAHPAMRAVGAGAVEDDVRLVDALAAPGVANDEEERLLTAARVARGVALEKAAP